MPKRCCRCYTKIVRKRKRVSVWKYAEILRNRMTPAEILLWKRLQKDMVLWGVVFESQGVVANKFVADFVCRELRLIVELDGSVHSRPSVRRKDKYRTMILERLGYRIVRFDNRDVICNCSKILNKIQYQVQIKTNNK